MDFRRSAARRRRVMREDVLDFDRSSGTTTSEASPFQRYNTEEVLRAQPMMLDWLPKGIWTNLFSSLAMLLICFAVIAIHYQPFTSQSNEASSMRIASQWNSLLSLHESSSLGHLFWTSSAMTSVVLVYQLFLLRRHREDDYQGSYQVWLWALPLSVVVALASVPSFRTMIGLTIESLLVGSQASVALACLLVILTGWTIAMTIRLFWELRESTFAAIVMIGSALVGCCGLSLWTCVLLQLPLGALGSLPADLPLTLSFAATIGWHVSLLSYLGYVCRDVIGLVGHSDQSNASSAEKAKTKPKSRKKNAQNDESDSSPIVELEDSSDVAEDDATTLARRSRRRVRRQAA